MTLALLLALPFTAAATEMDAEQEYLRECSRCHGVDGQGTAWAPANADEGEAGAFFWMATGRMPLDRPDQPVTRSRPRLQPAQIAAIARHVGDLGGGPPLPSVDPDAGDLAEGARIYLRECAACHGPTGMGGAMVEARNASAIVGVDPLIVAAAIRSGPAAMPPFDQDTLPAGELDSVVAYVLSLSHPPTPGGWDLGGWGAVAEGAAAWILGIVLAVGAAVWIKAGAGADEVKERWDDRGADRGAVE